MHIAAQSSAGANTGFFESDENRYWGARARLFVKDENDLEGWKELQEALKNDAAAWSIFAALLMTVGFGGLFVGSSQFSTLNDSVVLAQYVYVICMALCGGCAFIAVVIGTMRFIYYAGFPANLTDRAIAHDKQLGPSEFVYVSFIFVLIGCVAAGYVFFDVWAMLLVLLIGLIVTCIFIKVQSNHIRSLKSMGVKQGLMC